VLNLYQAEKALILQAVAAMQAAHGKKAAPNSTLPRSLHLHFLQTPSAVHKTPEGSVAALKLYASELATDATGTQIAQLTGQSSTLPVQLILKSVGYFGTPMHGVPFDVIHGIVPNRLGRVLQGVQADAGAVPGLYVCGWLKRGPSGIIGTNLVDAEQTAGCILEDSESLVASQSKAPDPNALSNLLQV
jgi:adrenodoxin-NADP+ reductase